MKKLLLLLPLSLLLHFLPAQGGMWLPMYLEKLNEKEMQAMGCKLSADDLYSAGEASVKDAICIFGGGCTGEMISPQGLLLTNHHCGFGQIQNHSTLEHNYVEDGFWSGSMAEELPCPGLTVTFINRMEDVTVRALMGVSEMMGEQDRQSAIDKNIERIKSETKREKHQAVTVRAFYEGNQYFLFVATTYTDVRFVGAPPSSIGKFGADTDNWVWPRHTGDFSMFRVYAGKDNLPAEYSADNQPYKPAHFLPINIAGVEEGDFTMVYGFPGRTTEYLPGVAVHQTAAVLDPARVDIRDRALKIMDGFMRKSPDVKIAYIARYAGIANSWKKWLGEMQGLETYGAMEKKTAYESDFTARIRKNADWNIRFKNLLPRLEQTYTELEPYALARDYYYEVFVRNTEVFGEIAGLNTWMNNFKTNRLAFEGKLPDVKAHMAGFYKDFRPEVDEAVTAGLLEMYAQNAKPEWGAAAVKTAADAQGGYTGLARYLFANSVFASKDKMTALLEGKSEDIGTTLNNDPAVVFWRAQSEIYQSKVAPKVNELQPQINLLQRQYMAAQMEVFKEKRFFPDANSTLRLTYGAVHGYSPRDAVRYEPRTYLDGVMEKYIPGDYEFDVPARLIELWKNKDYGPYATSDGRMPVAFLGTNHTTGGNSGAPALDANGNLVGLNFDRVWEGTMSDINYDPAICRNIMVDMRYILFIVDKYAGAKRLIDEMKIVKTGKKKRK